MSQNITVAVRIRPVLSTDGSATVYWEARNGNEIVNCDRSDRSSVKSYNFDRVFDQDASTDDVDDAVASSVIEGAMQGFNGTLFAYGQTASGKTFTMMGNQSQPGIIPKAVNQIFEWIETRAPEREFLVRVSYLEIYNENVVDLLGDVKKHLDVREDTNGSVFVNNLKEEIVTGAAPILNLMKQGEMNRRYGSTGMNEHSSRSHTIFRVIIESRERQQAQTSEGAVMVSHLNLVDLAGSEKAGQTGAAGQRLQEGCYINKSLLTLGQVIQRLSEGSSYVSYRDSKLTRILQNALGGNSKTAIIINVTPTSLDETHSTLRFATSAKKIKNTAVVNEVLSDEAMLRRYKRKISKLEKELVKMKEGELHKENQELGQMLAEKEKIQQEQQDKIQRLKELICVSSSIEPQEPQALTNLKVKKRRETWCPGKGRPFMPPPAALRSVVDRLALTELSPPGQVPLDTQFVAKKRGQSDIVPGMSPRAGGSLADELALAGGWLPPPTIGEEELLEESAQWQSSSRLEDIFTEKACTDAACQTTQEVDGDSEGLQEKNVRISELEGALKDKEEHLADVQSQLSQAQAQNVELKAQVEATVQNSQLEAKAVEESSKQAQEKLLAEMQQLQAQNTELKEHIEVLVESASSEESKKEAKDDQETAHTDPQPEIERLKAENERKQSELQETMEMCETLLKRINSETASKEQMEKEMSEKYAKLLNEFNELEMFTRLEQDFKNESILAKQQLGRLSLGSILDSTAAFSEALMSPSVRRAPVATPPPPSRDDNAMSSSSRITRDTAQLLEEVKQLRDELERAKTEGADRMSVSEVEHARFSRREVELKEQLDTAYQDNAALQEQLQQLQEGDSEERKPDDESDSASKQADVTTTTMFEEKIHELEMQLSLTTGRLSAAEELLMQPDPKADMALIESQLSLESEKLSASEGEIQQENTSTVALEERIGVLECELSLTKDKLTAAEELLQNDPSIKLPAFDEDTARINVEECDTLRIKCASLSEQVKSLELKVTGLELELESAKKQVATSSSSSLTSGEQRDLYIVRQELQKEQKANKEFRSKYGKLVEERDMNKEKYLSELNKDISQQKQLEVQDKRQKEAYAAFSKLQQENKEEIEHLNKQLHETNCQLQKVRSEAELATHKQMKAQEEIQKLQQEIRGLLDVQSRHEQHSLHSTVDPDKLRDHIKKLGVSLDLTKQRLTKLEGENKELKVLAKKHEDAAFERNTLQSQLRESRHQLEQKSTQAVQLQQRCSFIQADTAQLRLQLASMQDSHDKVKRENINLQQNIDQASRRQEQQVASKEGLEKQMLTLQIENKELTHKLEAQTEDLRAELFSAQTQTKDLQSQLLSLQDKNAGLQLEVGSWQKRLRDELEKKEQVLKQVVADKDELQAQLEAQQLEKETLRERLHVLEGETNEKDHYQQAQSKLQADKQQLQSELDDVHMEKEQLHKLLQELQVDKEQLQNKIDAALLSQKDALQSKSEAMQSAKEEFQRKLEVLQSEKEELLCNFQSSEQSNKDGEELKSKFDAVCSQKEDLQGKFDDLQSEKEQLHRLLQELQLDKEELQSKLEALESEKDQLLRNFQPSEQSNKDEEELKSKFDAVCSQKEALQGKFDDMQSEKEQLHRLLQELQLDKEELQSKLDAIQSEKEEFQSQLEALESEKEQLLTDFQALQTSKDELQSRLSESERTKREFEELIVVQEGGEQERMRQLEAERDEAKSEVEEQHMHTQQMELEVHSLQAQKEQMEQEIVTLQEEKKKLNDDLAHAVQAAEQTKQSQEAFPAQPDNDDDVDYWKHQVSLKERMIKDLQTDYDESFARWKKNVSDADEELEQEVEKNRQLTDSLKAAQDAHQAVTSELDDLQQSYDTNDAFLKKCCDEADAELEQEQQKCRELSKTVSTLKASHAAAEAELSELQDTNLELQADIATLKRQLEDSQQINQVRSLTQSADGENWQEKAVALSKELEELQQSYDTNDAFLKKCCDEADAELEQEQQKCRELSKTVSTLKASQAAAEAELSQLQAVKVQLEKEVAELKRRSKDVGRTDALAKELHDLRFKYSVLEESHEKLNEDCKFLNKVRNEFFESNQALKNELRRLKNEELEESVCQSKPSACRSSRCPNLAAVNKQSMLEAQINILQAKKEEVESKLEAMEKKLSHYKVIESELRHQVSTKKRQLAHKEEEVRQFRFYYNRELGEQEKKVVRDLVHPAPGPLKESSTQTDSSCRKPSQASSRSMSDIDLARAAHSHQEFLRLQAAREEEDEDKPSECSQQ